MKTYKADAVMDMSYEGERGQHVEKRKFEAQGGRQKKSGRNSTSHRNQQPAEHFAPSVTHLGDDQLAANVREDDAHHESVTPRIALQYVSGRSQYPDCGQREKHKRTN